MFSLGMFSALAAAIAARRRGLESGSPPPSRAAMVISRMSLVKILPRRASAAAFLCLMVAHFECPDIVLPRRGETGCSLLAQASLAQAPAAEKLSARRVPGRSGVKANPVGVRCGQAGVELEQKAGNICDELLGCSVVAVVGGHDGDHVGFIGQQHQTRIAPD